VLLPTPSFFPYAQDDVLAFCTAVEAGLSIPIILYNLPQFTTGFEILAVRALAVRSGIIGIKDSSGLLDICRSLSGNSNRFQRLVGNDMVIVQALDEGICDGVISGVAGVLPELISFLVRRHTPEHSARYRRANRLLEELLEKLSAFPTPWAIKWIAECRGFGAASFLQPLSEQRRHEAKRFQEWFAAWWDGVARFLESA
jgi:4-hydroxy-tetrahydrodipicolinate synthase